MALPLILPSLTTGIDPPVHTTVYEGPLDLLLVLVRHEGVDIRQIPIARICDSYLIWLARAEASGALDIDAVGDYLLMAATLCQLKARELLPHKQAGAGKDGAPDADHDTDAENGQDITSRERLVQRLLEYERYRVAAEELKARESLDRDVFARPHVDVPLDEQPIEAACDAMGLGLVYVSVMAALGVPDPVHAVEAERLSFSFQARAILNRLGNQSVPLHILMTELTGHAPMLVQDGYPTAVQAPIRRRKIFVFLAVLEMVRLQLVQLEAVDSKDPFGPILVRATRVLAEDDLSALPEAL